MLEIIKNIIKSLGLYKFTANLILRSNLFLKLFIYFLSLFNTHKGIKLRSYDQSGVTIIDVQDKNKIVRVSSQHAFYLQDIIGNFDYYFQAVNPESVGGSQIVDYSKPREHTLRSSGLSFYFTSFAEPLETNNIYLEKGNLKSGDIVFDIGSYCGTSVWSFSKAVGDNGQVYAFEPDAKNYQALKMNITKHALKNAIIINKGIWSRSQRLSFQSEANMGSGITTVVERGTSVYEIDVVSLDDVCREYHIQRIDYIKMDIEGSELEVLKSAEAFLQKYKPRLIIEPHVINARLATDEVCSILKKYNYTCEIIPQAGLPLPLIYAQPNKR